MEQEIEVRTHHSIGPVADMYGHGPVTTIGTELVVCMDCGYTAADNRMLAHIECDRSENDIAQTWREYLDSEDLSNLPTASDDEEWPIE